MKAQLLVLDEKRVERTIHQLLLALKAEIACGPMSRERVFEALNALAVVAASVLNGTVPERGAPPDKVATRFFDEALKVHLSGHHRAYEAGDQIYFVEGKHEN